MLSQHFSGGLAAACLLLMMMFELVRPGVAPPGSTDLTPEQIAKLHDAHVPLSKETIEFLNSYNFTGDADNNLIVETPDLVTPPSRDDPVAQEMFKARAVLLMTPLGNGPKLPELALGYDDARVVLRAGAHILVNSDYLADLPILQWDHLPYKGKPDDHISVIFIDFGPGPTEADSQKSWTGYPFVHSLWTDCSEPALYSCRTVRPWKRPGNTDKAANRYTFFVFATPAPLKILGQDPFNPTSAFDLSVDQNFYSFSIPRLVDENPDLAPLGYTYMAVNYHQGWT
jgi:hypothetical protein